jgi:hypothetical protein
MIGAIHPNLSFTDAVLVNVNRLDHRALEARVNWLVATGQSRIPSDRVRILRNDANGVLDIVLANYHQRDYLWVFAAAPLSSQRLAPARPSQLLPPQLRSRPTWRSYRLEFGQSCERSTSLSHAPQHHAR